MNQVPAEWREETVRVASLCTFSLEELKYEYPREVVPEGETPASQLRKLTCEGARRRYPNGMPDKVHKQIEHELKIIAQLEYESYFLTVADIVHWARDGNILCQGRESAANSAVCYCLEVTNVDPDRMSVRCERFISMERKEPPDIDVDFEHQRREEAMHLVILLAALFNSQPMGFYAPAQLVRDARVDRRTFRRKPSQEGNKQL